MNPEVVGPIGIVLIIAVAVIVFPVARAFARRLDQRGIAPPVPNDLAQRLDRLEQTMDSVALEVERISEGQRFTTKLLAEQKPGVVPGSGGAK
ncbi:MAG TPA: hypothetical protein VGR59_07160 [Gemmatimonadaceae bacterium]|nr:hypothetical protein [Gemmatimonadaceae bacterium]